MLFLKFIERKIFSPLITYINLIIKILKTKIKHVKIGKLSIFKK